MSVAMAKAMRTKAKVWAQCSSNLSFELREGVGVDHIGAGLGLARGATGDRRSSCETSVA